MQVTQPNEFYKGLPKEDVFFVKDDQNNPVGEGFLIYQYQPTIFPSRPVNIYFSMTSKPEGEYWLLGSLAARARQLRNQAPGAAARLYTAVDVQDKRQLAFYEHNGFKMDYTEDLVRLNDPDEVPQLFNCSCITLPLNTVQEQMDLVSRMRGAGFSYFDHGFLLQQMNRQNFAALGILYGSNLVGACVAAGQYTSAEVMGLYIVPEFQRKGLGTRLLQQTKQALASTGVTDLTMRVMSDSEPQVRLVQRFRAELVEHTSVFPSMQI